jgi:hypothetical protein
MRKVIVNSTPIIALSKAGRLHLLKEDNQPAQF